MFGRFFLIKFIILLLALQILNLSIYAQDNNLYQTDSTVYETNEINSVMEYVGEVILKHKNQFPEYPNDGHKDSPFLKHSSFKVFTFSLLKVQPANKAANINYTVPVTEDYCFLFLKEINPPPPKA